MTGLSVKTVRYYSDIGLVSEASRSPTGYRRYDASGIARLELVRALRDLGLDLAAIKQIMHRQSTLADVAAAHADAVDATIRQLTLRRAVLRALAQRGARPEEVQRMSAFINASADKSRRIMEEFLDVVFARRADDPFAVRMRSALPELPEQPTDAQIDAWVELAALVNDADFRARVRQMVSDGAKQRAEAGISDTDAATQKAGHAVVERAGAAVAAGIKPDSPQSAAIVAELVGHFASAAGRTDDPAYRRDLAAQLEMFSDRRVERYWQLIGVINGWPSTPSLMPGYEWFQHALRAS